MGFEIVKGWWNISSNYLATIPKHCPNPSPDLFICFRYFIAFPVGKTFEQHLYRVGDWNSDDFKATYCLTCNNSASLNETRHPCLYNSAKFSPSFKYYVHECLGPEVPSTNLRLTSDNSFLDLLQGNAAVNEKLKMLAQPKLKTFKVLLNTGDSAFVRFYIPPGFRENRKQKYPLILEM